jgi:hypothetical protein
MLGTEKSTLLSWIHLSSNMVNNWGYSGYVGTILQLIFFCKFLLSFFFLINKVYVLTTNTTFLDSLHVSRGYREREGSSALSCQHA